jgi:hypothetical protein
MANSSVRYVASGDTQEFAVTFPFISRTHVTVTVAGSAATFTWNNDSLITVTDPADITSDQVVLIKRSTSPATRLVDYVDGSNLSETDLDLDSKQAFYMAQEALDELTLLDDAAIATSGYILVADGTDFAGVAMSGDTTIGSGGAVAIASGVIVNADVNSSAAIAYSKLTLTGAVLSADLAGSIDATKIANGSVTSTEFQYINTLSSNAQTQIDNVAAGVLNFTTINTDTPVVADSIVFGDANDSEDTDKTTIATLLALYDTKTSTMTNKTITAPVISGSASAAGTILFKEDTDNGTNSCTLSGPQATADVTVTLPAATDTLVGKATTDTLTNKTLTSPVIDGTWTSYTTSTGKALVMGF